MSGLLALLDDVAAIAKIAAASVDDVMGQAVKASSKAAGAVIDDAAVTPKYLHGFSAERELPIVWRIARGSLFNKVIILLPIALLLSTFLPILIYPLLMLGGGYLCYEGAEKVWHVLSPSHHDQAEAVEEKLVSGAHLEEQKVKGAIKTDFILSAEIMTIILSALPEGQPIWIEAMALAMAGILITIAVYGAVAIIVKMDDLGLAMADHGRLGLTRKLGAGIVRGMPYFMQLLIIIGTAAMIWVGGSILVHGLHELGWHLPYDTIHHIAVGLAEGAGDMAGTIEWIVTAFLDGVIGITVGAILIPIVSTVTKMFGGKKEAAH